MITGLLALIAPEKRLVIMEQHFIDPVDVVVVIDDKIFHDDIKFPAVRKRISGPLQQDPPSAADQAPGL